jgi:opacity protein-like surface antigen
MRKAGYGLALVVALGIVSAGLQSAQAGDGWYFEGAGGGSWQSDYDFDISGPGTVGVLDFDTGFNVSGAIGYQTGNWRLEGETVYFESNVDSFSSIVSAPLDGKSEIIGAMFNAIYEFDLGGIRPYIGAGVGAARAYMKNIGPSGGIPLDVDAETTLFAYQAKAGISIALTDTLDLFGGYRYFGSFDAFDISVSTPGPSGSFTADRVEIHSVEGGLRFYFGGPTPSGGSDAMPTAAGTRDGWYAQASGAAAWLYDQDLLELSIAGVPAIPPLLSVDYDTGYGGSAGIGYQVGSWRFEGEITYLTASIDSADPIILPPVPASGDREVLAVMGNVLYEFDVGGIYPFFGIGLGPARVWLDDFSGPLGNSMDTETTVFAYQAKASAFRQHRYLCQLPLSEYLRHARGVGKQYRRRSTRNRRFEASRRRRRAPVQFRWLIRT